MIEKTKSWGPVVLAGAIAAAQFFMAHTLDSLDRRVGAMEAVLMSPKK